ncbi:MAG: MAPEG family protein [Arenicella sp.]|nr:MAPEG family protein [Arenicella sp.]
MNLAETYLPAFWGILIVILTVLVQWVVASGAKARAPGAIPGKIDESLSHSSFVFRAHRTFMNSLENIHLLLGTAFLAIFIGASAYWTGIFVWLFAAARIAHMILYYRIPTETNPSPRTWFFMLGFVANVCLLTLCVITLI